jgi:PAS domain S-box-containing protein
MHGASISATARPHADLHGAARAQLIRHSITPSLLVFAAYVVAGEIGQATSNIRSGNIGPVWPAYGIALAAVLYYRTRAVPAVFISAFVVAYTSPVAAGIAFGQAAGATLAAGAGAWLCLRTPGFHLSLRRLRDATTFIIFGAFGSATISATIGIFSLYAGGNVGYSGLWSGWLIYWLGDATGALLITPLVFTAASLVSGQPGRRLFELGTLVVLVTIASIVVFGESPVVPIRLHAFAFAIVPFVMWGAIRFEIAGAALVMLVIASLATVLSAVGAGPFATHTPFINAIMLDVLFGTLAVSGLALGAVITERRDAEAERARLDWAQATAAARLHLAAIVESSHDAVLSMSPDGIVLSWNSAAERIFGVARAEAVGRAVDQLIASWPADAISRGIAALQSGQPVPRFDITTVSRTGERVDLAVTVALLHEPSGGIAGVSTIMHDVSAAKRAEAELSHLSRRLLHAQEEERRRVARELHDDIGQRLSLLAVHMQGSPALQEQVSQIATDVQALSHALHSSRLEVLGLRDAARNFCTEFATQHHVHVRCDAEEMPARLPADVSICLFRILQEALRNAAKHSGDRVFLVRLWVTPTLAHLTVADHGRGFDVNALQQDRGIGLSSMKERAKLVRGAVTIESRVGGGTVIHAGVPLAA